MDDQKIALSYISWVIGLLGGGTTIFCSLIVLSSSIFGEHEHRVKNLGVGCLALLVGASFVWVGKESYPKY